MWRINAGKPLAAFDAPSSLFAFGDTGDSPRYTICANYILQYYPPQSPLRYGGEFNMAFVDGHAKAVRFAGGTMGGNIVGLPASQTDGDMYCDNPSAVDSNVGMTCQAWVSYLYKNTTFWPNK